MQLFDIIKNIFSTNNKTWNQVGRIDKSRNFFMINRIMAIQFPVQANQFNRMRIIPGPVVDWWRNTLSGRYSKPPNWIYTKTKKTSTEDKIKETKNFDQVEIFIREKYSVSKRELSDIKSFYPDRYNKWISDVADQLGIQK
jgi:hypothetical protein